MPTPQAGADVRSQDSEHTTTGVDPLVRWGCARGAGDHHGNFPNGPRHGHLVIDSASREFGRPADDENFATPGGQRPAVILKLSPKALVVRGCLRDDVTHSKKHGVIVVGGGAIGRGTHMPAVQRDSVVGAESGGSDFQIPAGQKFLHRPSIGSGLGPVIRQRIAPTHPVGLVGVVIVGQNKLRSGNQVVSPDHRIGDRPRGISQGHLIIDSQSGPRSAGQKPEDRAQSCDSERTLHLVFPSTKKKGSTFANQPEINRLPNSLPSVRWVRSALDKTDRHETALRGDVRSKAIYVHISTYYGFFLPFFLILNFFKLLSNNNKHTNLESAKYVLNETQVNLM